MLPAVVLHELFPPHEEASLLRHPASAKQYDHLDFIRGFEAFLNCVPAASLEALRRGVVASVGDARHQGAITDRLMDSNPLFLTGNTDAVYALAMLDIER